ncbi:MAG: ATP-dependent protease, Lon family [Firmicutes bacterium]|nr:ATP-dependent protease, Lon family [Bacillota bacterium]
MQEYLDQFTELKWENIIENTDLLNQRINALFALTAQVMGPDLMINRAAKMDILNLIDHEDPLTRIWGLQKLMFGEKDLDKPRSDQVVEITEQLESELADYIARRMVEDRLDRIVNEKLTNQQDSYVKALKLSLINEEDGPENENTLKKLEELNKLEKRKAPLMAMERMRPQNLDQVVGQDQAKIALMSKLATPYPQHILLYGPPGVGKTTVARLVLEMARNTPHSAFGSDAPFIEVNGTTLRWDPREVTNPLIGSVHDPIYQGARRDLADSATPEPKPGLVTEAHGGILFIDEIGEMDYQLQAKLLKVLEDKRVFFESAYYDPENTAIPEYIHRLFKEGAPANFILIGATTRSPEEINPAIRSRCAEVFFDPLYKKDIEDIVLGSASRLKISLEEGGAGLIADHTDEARKAVNILADSYGYVISQLEEKHDRRRKIAISNEDITTVLQISRIAPQGGKKASEQSKVGQVFGLGAYGFTGSVLEIEAAVFTAGEPGKGQIRFNDTAGSMAKDSLFVASSVIRRNLGIRLSDYDIHVNVVGGGQVDGPSAGAALTLALISALNNKPLKQNIALTGEISLHGFFKPVGGLYGKLYGAARAGITEVLIPEENKNELPEELYGVKLTPIKTIEEALDIMLEK